MATFPVSHAQRNLWIAEQLGMAGPALSTVEAIELDGPLDASVLRRAVHEMVRRHAVLRTTIELVHGELRQRVHADVAIRVPVTELTDVDGAGAAGSWVGHPAVREQTDAPFDLAVDYPIRAAVYRIGGRTGLVVVIHHVASDMASADIVRSELAALYGAFLRGLPSPLPEPAHQYAELAEREQSTAATPRLQEASRYWRERLADLPPPIDLAFGAPRPHPPSSRVGAVRRSLPAESVAGLTGLAQSERVTVFAVSLAAYAVLLAAVGGQRDVIVAVPVLQREEKAAADLIGCFLTILPVRVSVDAGLTVRDLLQNVWTAMIEALEHRHLPFDQIVEAVPPQRNRGFRQLAQVAFTAAELRERECRFGPVPAVSITVERAATTYDLMAYVQTAPDLAEVVLEYCPDVLTHETAEHLLTQYADVLRTMAGDPAAPVEMAVKAVADEAPRPQPVATTAVRVDTDEPAAADAAVTARIGAIWTEILGVADIRPTDDFYELGGRSLAMIKLVVRISEEFGTELPFSEVLQAPTVAEQARLVSRGMES